MSVSTIMLSTLLRGFLPNIEFFIISRPDVSSKHADTTLSSHHLLQYLGTRPKPWMSNFLQIIALPLSRANEQTKHFDC